MKTVEVLIRIPQVYYDYILSQGDTRGTPYLAEAICNGTVLSKKHGKIIDSKQFFIALNKYLEERKSFCYADLETVINCCTPPIVKENTYGDS